MRRDQIVECKCEKDKEIHALSDEFEFDNANENEVNEPPNTTLSDFDVYTMDNSGHVTANNDENIVYNDQPYFKEPNQDNQIFCLECVCGIV